MSVPSDAALPAPGGYDGASATAIRHHYDAGNAFFALWLDPTMTYSCALWQDDDDDHQTAQERKLDYLAGGAGAGPGARVLDVGCGWGSMLRRLVEHHGIDRAVGLTLSDAQAEHVRAQGDERCESRIENWTAHEPLEPYDAIVSIGAFEHFASFSMPRQERIEAYRRFFARCHDWIVPGGRLALQSIVKGSNVRLDRQTTRDMLFIVDRIFPESEIPWLSEMLEASERRFDVVSIRNDPAHYAKTCNLWLKGLLANREPAEELVGEQMVADYVRYLGAIAQHFADRHQGLARVVFQRV
jgi:cyclopropane-fatty-acyl-phospholipid synthase